MVNVRIARSKQAIMEHFKVRGEVFILEQHVPWVEEFDDWDFEATHFNAYLEGTIVGTARLYQNKVGRVAVLKEHRRKGVGEALMRAVERYAKTHHIDQLTLGAQLHVKAFYEALGYEAYGERFMDANIEHIMMRKKV